MRPSKNQNVLLNYQPNLVSQQFGLNHIMPKPLFNKKRSVILYNMHHTEAGCNEEISWYVGITQFTHVSFKPSFYYTQEYDTWWRNYYSTKMFDVSVFTQYLTNTFASVQDKYKKGT